ncbi:MAG: zf-TFIIB domain-containing protein [Polyangiaceae bacterium]|nr:zf-TFIIB domain-containing protein [Polyangiaceae bacterium]
MTAYRQNQPLCPTCSQPLESLDTHAPQAVVDICKQCGGVWLDWEDGDFTDLARQIPPVAGRTIARGGLGDCPRCNKELIVEVFRDVAEVLRCSECAGAFVPYASIGKLSECTPAADMVEQPKGFWARVIGALKTKFPT